MHIGIAGIGNMGSNIGARLMEVGHTLTVWNRSAGKTKALADVGAGVVATAAELAGAVEAVITIVTNADALDAVYHGPQGLLSGNVTGKLFIEMSTVPPEAQIALAAKVRAKGGAYVECPVSGSVIPARSGKLMGLMGAEPADAARARPILEQLCRRVMHAGPVGSGALLKLAVNLPLMIYWQALGEQLSLCKDLKIDPVELLDFLSETSGAATVLKQRMPGIAARLKNEKSDIGTFNLDGGIKDVTAMLAEAGASIAKSPAELASSVEAVITIITNADAIEAMYHGPNGLLSGDVKGRLFIEMSTVPPEVQIALAAKVRAKGAAYVECPVGGSVIPARSGKLMGLMGAEPADAARARPILEHLCRRVLHTGPVGLCGEKRTPHSCARCATANIPL